MDKPDGGGNFKADRPDPGLTANWWQTYVAIPASADPFDRCDLGTGKVVFLAGTTGGEAHRSCTLPKDKTVLVPLINGECSEAEGNGSTFADLSACASGLLSGVTSLTLEIDGKVVPNLNSFSVQTGLFTFNSVADSVFAPQGLPAATNNKSVANGFWALIKLTPGEHRITFGGAVGTAFATKATYDLVIKK